MTVANISIRELRPTDLDEVMRLEQETPEAPHWQRSEYEKLFEAQGELRRRGVIAILDGMVGGYAVAKVLTAAGQTEAELETIVVRSDVRRRGTGGAVLQALLEQLATDGATVLRLEVRLSNMAAISLYKAYGFDRTGVRRRYYSDPVEDAVLMELRTFLRSK